MLKDSLLLLSSRGIFAHSTLAVYGYLHVLCCTLNMMFVL